MKSAPELSACLETSEASHVEEGADTKRSRINSTKRKSTQRDSVKSQPASGRLLAAGFAVEKAPEEQPTALHSQAVSSSSTEVCGDTAQPKVIDTTTRAKEQPATLHARSVLADGVSRILNTASSDSFDATAASSFGVFTRGLNLSLELPDDIANEILAELGDKRKVLEFLCKLAKDRRMYCQQVQFALDTLVKCQLWEETWQESDDLRARLPANMRSNYDGEEEAMAERLAREAQEELLALQELLDAMGETHETTMRVVCDDVLYPSNADLARTLGVFDNGWVDGFKDVVNGDTGVLLAETSTPQAAVAIRLHRNDGVVCIDLEGVEKVEQPENESVSIARPAEQELDSETTSAMLPASASESAPASSQDVYQNPEDIRKQPPRAGSSTEEVDLSTQGYPQSTDVMKREVALALTAGCRSLHEREPDPSEEQAGSAPARVVPQGQRSDLANSATSTTPLPSPPLLMGDAAVAPPQNLVPEAPRRRKRDRMRAVFERAFMCLGSQRAASV